MFLAQNETVTAITELIHCNQPVPVAPLLTCLKDEMSMNTLYPGLVCNFFIIFGILFACLILACA